MSEREAAKLAGVVAERMADGWGNIAGDLLDLAQRAPTAMRWRAKLARREWKSGNTDIALVWLLQLARERP